MIIDKYRDKNKYSITEHIVAAHYGYLLEKTLDDVDLIELDPNTASSFRGDFRGLLNTHKIHPSLFGYNLYLNKMSNMTEYDGRTSIFLCGSSAAISMIYKIIE